MMGGNPFKNLTNGYFGRRWAFVQFHDFPLPEMTGTSREVP
jgi:hypothetical protein